MIDSEQVDPYIELRDAQVALQDDYLKLCKCVKGLQQAVVEAIGILDPMTTVGADTTEIQVLKSLLEGNLAETDPFSDQDPAHLLIMPTCFKYDALDTLAFVADGLKLEGRVPAEGIFVLCPDKRCAVYTDDEHRRKIREWDSTGKMIFDTVGIDDVETADGEEEQG